MSELPSKELRKKRERMREVVSRLQKYIATYSDQPDYDLYSDETFIKDIVYGIGVAIDPNEYRCADGFDKFKPLVLPHVQSAPEPRAEPLAWAEYVGEQIVGVYENSPGLLAEAKARGAILVPLYSGSPPSEVLHEWKESHWAFGFEFLERVRNSGPKDCFMPSLEGIECALLAYEQATGRRLSETKGGE